MEGSDGAFGERMENTPAQGTEKLLAKADRVVTNHRIQEYRCTITFPSVRGITSSCQGGFC